MYNLMSAAAAAGVNRSTVLRAIKAGRVSAQRDATGGWEIDPAEFHRGREKCLERGCAGFYMTPVRTVPASASKAVTSSIIVPTSYRLDAFARSADIYNGRRQFTHVELKAECP